MWLFKRVSHREANDEWEFWITVMHWIMLLFTLQSVFQQKVSPMSNHQETVKRICHKKTTKTKQTCYWGQFALALKFSLDQELASKPFWQDVPCKTITRIQSSCFCLQEGFTCAVNQASLLELLEPKTEILCSSTCKRSLSVWHDIVGQVWAQNTTSADVWQNNLNQKYLIWWKSGSLSLEKRKRSCLSLFSRPFPSGRWGYRGVL